MPLSRLIQQIGKVERAALFQIARAGGLDRRRDLVNRQVCAGQRRGRDHLHTGRLCGQLQRYGAQERRRGAHFDGQRLCRKPVLRNLQPVASVRQARQDVRPLRIGEKAAIHADVLAAQSRGRLHRRTRRILDLQADFAGPRLCPGRGGGSQKRGEAQDGATQTGAERAHDRKFPAGALCSAFLEIIVEIERAMPIRRFPIVCVLLLLALGRPALACKCLSSLSPCNQAGASDVVFIGTVESLDPVFLNRWNLLTQSSMTSLNEAYIDARQHPSGESIARLKNAYQKAFPDLAADQTSRLQDAKTAAGVASLSIPGWAAECACDSK